MCDQLCGWILYDIEIPDQNKPLVGGGGMGNPPSDTEAKDETDKRIKHLKEIGVLTKPHCEPKADCECKPVGRPTWEDDFTEGWTWSFDLNGWTVEYQHIKVKLGRRDGVCSPRRKVLKLKAGE